MRTNPSWHTCLFISGGRPNVVTAEPKYARAWGRRGGHLAGSPVPALASGFAVLDVELPGMNGIEAFAQIKSTSPSTRVIMLTVFDDHEKVFKAICAGASGYLLGGQNAAIELQYIGNNQFLPLSHEGAVIPQRAPRATGGAATVWRTPTAAEI